MPDVIVGRRRPRRWRAVRRLMAASLLPLLISGGIRAARAQALPPPAANGRTIEAIEFKGLKALSEETLRYYLGLAPGQPLNEEALNKNLKQLWDRNLVDDVQVESVPTANGVRLVITVVERPTLRSIDYQGLKQISKTDLQDKLTTQHIRVHEGEPLSLGELQRVKALIEEMYGEKGFRFATASYAISEVAPNEKKVIFTVDEGDRVRISQIEFEGNTVFTDSRLRLSMTNTKESAFISRIAKKDLYDPAKLQEDLEKVRDLYRGIGYKNVVMGDPKIDVRAVELKETAHATKEQKRRMFITIPVEEGERWKFGQVSVEGNKVYPEKNLLRVFERKATGWLKSKVVDDGVKAITDAYHNTGYIFARIEPELVERPDRVADLVIHITEGDQFKVGRIEVQGNERTKDKVLRRELRVYEGGLVNVTAIRNSVTKVNQLGYFKLNEENPVDIDTDSEKKKVNLLFKGEESDRTQLQFGGGWSQLDGFFGQFGISTKNFLGRGEEIGISVQTGDLRKYYDLSYSIPWFLDKPQSVGIRAYDETYDYSLFGDQDRYIRDSKGVVLTYGRNFKLFQSASISYNFSHYNDETQIVVPPLTPGEVPPPADEPQPGSTVTTPYRIHNSSIRPSYLYDSRDNPFEPSHGQKISLAVEYAGGPLGGDNYFLRPEVGYSLFTPVTNYPVKTVFAFNAEGGVIHALGNQPINVLERFFLGGENSIRGHNYRSIFLRDKDGNPLRDENEVILGGDSYAQFNFEYHFVLGGPFRVLLFTDMGNVFGEGQTFSFSNLRRTAGVELRVFLPVFGAPLRFIYAKNLTPLPQDSFQTFQFSIGTSF
ncbi:MAG TPA: outer membrane protein assembly factor BamA [Thermoanaerobaculia bacterium]|nr:outer membrane protein assembly factor BamA [Thermoanaerobaculia bacterium]